MPRIATAACLGALLAAATSPSHAEIGAPVEHREAENRDLLVTNGHYQARISSATGALAWVRDRAGRLHVGGEGLRLRLAPGGPLRGLAEIQGVRLSIVRSSGSGGTPLQPSRFYLRVVTEGFLLPSRLTVRRTYEFTPGRHLYEQMEIFHSPARPGVHRISDLGWSFDLRGPARATKTASDLLIRHPHFDALDTTSPAHPGKSYNPAVRGRVLHSVDSAYLNLSRWDASYSAFTLERDMRLLTSVAISILQPGEEPARFGDDPFVNAGPGPYCFYPWYGLVAEFNRSATSFNFINWNVYGEIARQVPIGAENGRPVSGADRDRRLDTLLRVGMHVLERMVKDGGWVRWYAWGDGQYPAGLIYTAHARAVRPLVYLWARLALEWNGSRWVERGDTATWAILETLWSTLRYFEEGAREGFSDLLPRTDGSDRRPIPFFGYNSPDRLIEGGELAVINTHAQSISLVCLMEDLAALRGDVAGSRQWGRLRRQHHGGSRALWARLYPGPRGGRAHPGYVAYGLGAGIHDNIGYCDATYNGFAPDYLRAGEHELGFVQCVEEAGRQLLPWPTAQDEPWPMPQRTSRGALCRAFPPALAFLQAPGAGPEPDDAPLAHKNATDLHACLELGEVLRHELAPRIARHQPARWIRQDGGRRWVYTNVPFRSEWTPGYWEEIALSGMREQDRFFVEVRDEAGREVGGATAWWAASRTGNSFEIMSNHRQGSRVYVRFLVSGSYATATLTVQRYQASTSTWRPATRSTLAGTRWLGYSVFEVPQGLGPKDHLVLEVR